VCLCISVCVLFCVKCECASFMHMRVRFGGDSHRYLNSYRPVHACSLKQIKLAVIFLCTCVSFYSTKIIGLKEILMKVRSKMISNMHTNKQTKKGHRLNLH
jgi:hypothetical protein